eukprot:TRINITY_DN20283_c0_g1_i2.p1 TRINITY_DN20283_c0_g1~~TRINITY_DN20283_c0_g1_i2.p1  ORF type:complete len:496 (-),score=107.66 TRINITY_DN20283_c0_g1_i2:248-1735(-)
MCIRERLWETRKSGQLQKKYIFLMLRRPPRSTQSRSSAASDVYKRQLLDSLPQKLRDIFDNSIIELTEEKNVIGTKISQVIKCKTFPGIRIEIETLSSDMSVDVMAGDIPAEVDVINDFHDELGNDIAYVLSNSLRIPNTENWRINATFLTTIHKRITIRSTYETYQEEILQLINVLVKKYIGVFYRMMIARYSDWVVKAPESLNRMDSYNKMQKQSSSEAKYFPLIFESFEDIEQYSRLLGFLKKVKLYGSDYVFNEIKDELSLADFDRQILSSPNSRGGSLVHRTGYLYKRGDGPIDYSWNSRYFVLDGRTLYYYKTADEKKARAIIKLQGSYVSQIYSFESREYVFSIEVPNINKKYFISGDTRQQTSPWREAINKASQMESGGDESIKKKPYIPPLKLPKREDEVKEDKEVEREEKEDLESSGSIAPSKPVQVSFLHNSDNNWVQHSIKLFKETPRNKVLIESKQLDNQIPPEFHRIREDFNDLILSLIHI